MSAAQWILLLTGIVALAAMFFSFYEKYPKVGYARVVIVVGSVVATLFLQHEQEREE
jgi:hypothetical protein